MQSDSSLHTPYPSMRSGAHRLVCVCVERKEQVFVFMSRDPSEMEGTSGCSKSSSYPSLEGCGVLRVRQGGKRDDGEEDHRSSLPAEKW